MGGTFGRMPQARYARLSGAATHPAGARPSISIILVLVHFYSISDGRGWAAEGSVSIVSTTARAYLRCCLVTSDHVGRIARID
jgi:hypothetical protein